MIGEANAGLLSYIVSCRIHWHPDRHVMDEQKERKTQKRGKRSCVTSYSIFLRLYHLLGPVEYDNCLNVDRLFSLSIFSPSAWRCMEGDTRIKGYDTRKRIRKNVEEKGRHRGGRYK